MRSGAAPADFGTLTARPALLLDQFKVLDFRAPKPKEDMLAVQTNCFFIPSRSDLAGYHGAYKGPYLTLARAAAQRHGVPEEIFLRLVE